MTLKESPVRKPRVPFAPHCLKNRRCFLGEWKRLNSKRRKKGDPGSKLCNEPQMGGDNPSETKVVSLSPDKILEDVDNVRKSPGDAK